MDTCTRAATGATAFCVAHGGGKRCQLDGAVSRPLHGTATDAQTDDAPHSIAERCCSGGAGCNKAVRGGNRTCFEHGGGNRCERDKCNKATSGGTSMCLAHGGGKRCGHLNCPKGARGATDYCVLHGGGKAAAQQDGSASCSQQNADEEKGLLDAVLTASEGGDGGREVREPCVAVQWPTPSMSLAAAGVCLRAAGRVHSSANSVVCGGRGSSWKPSPSIDTTRPCRRWSTRPGLSTWESSLHWKPSPRRY